MSLLYAAVTCCKEFSGNGSLKEYMKGNPERSKFAWKADRKQHKIMQGVSKWARTLMEQREDILFSRTSMVCIDTAPR